MMRTGGVTAMAFDVVAAGAAVDVAAVAVAAAGALEGGAAASAGAADSAGAAAGASADAVVAGPAAVVDFVFAEVCCLADWQPAIKVTASMTAKQPAHFCIRQVVLFISSLSFED